MPELETHQEETKPKAPQGLKAAIEESQSTPTPPSMPRVVVDSTAVTPPKGMPLVVPVAYQVEAIPAPSNTCLSSLMLLGVMGLVSCMCLLIVSLAGVAGIQDELHAVGTEAASTKVAEVATQYQLANQDLAAGNTELSLIRLQDVVTKLPDYRDAASLLSTVEAIASYTPTASPTASPIPATVAPTEAVVGVTPPPQASNDPLDPAQLYGRADSAYNVGLYEEAIEWFDTLVLVDPSYRRQDVLEKRLDAMIKLGTSYLRGTNTDGQDRLSQGIQLIWRADELGDVPGEVLYEADFVARYLSARGMVEGGAAAQAQEVLTRLCEEDCDWSYNGVSVRDLLSQAGGSPN